MRPPAWFIFWFVVAGALLIAVASCVTSVSEPICLKRHPLYPQHSYTGKCNATPGDTREKG
jgi:hypothetical protein